MPRQAKLRSVHTAKGWQLNIPADLSPTGKRQRFYYKTRDEAHEASTNHKEQRDQFGANAVAIAPSLAKEAVQAEAILRPPGASVLAVAKLCAEEEREGRASVPIEMALADYTVAKEHLSEKQVQAIRQMTTHLLADFKGRQLVSITHDELAAHLNRRTGGDGASSETSPSSWWRTRGR